MFFNYDRYVEEAKRPQSPFKLAAFRPNCPTQVTCGIQSVLADPTFQVAPGRNWLVLRGIPGTTASIHASYDGTFNRVFVRICYNERVDSGVEGLTISVIEPDGREIGSLVTSERYGNGIVKVGELQGTFRFSLKTGVDQVLGPQAKVNNA